MIKRLITHLIAVRRQRKIVHQAAYDLYGLREVDAWTLGMATGLPDKAISNAMWHLERRGVITVARESRHHYITSVKALKGA